ncbi:MAG: tRNA (adenosine(37)-N6)-threonylcarbamoyltransferase complex ATPase subunit type 1 TsaE [Sideroxydans sp.]|nr:tRNA (adenosine(37)-N6)-threonylcarbamoyltransferase complex ATPase subunit type 1 TsaE [Sideroxydans sp.]
MKQSAARQTLAIHLADEAATTALAARFARTLQAGVVIYLDGNLGAGKTTFVRSVLQTLGYEGRVKSPTYTLIERYEAGGLQLRHFDLYRFRDEEEWESAGFRDEFDGHNVCMVEWPELAGQLLPAADIVIAFDILLQGRTVTISAFSNLGEQCLNTLHA